MKRSELIFTAITVPLDYATLVVAALAAYEIRHLKFITEIRPVVFDLTLKNFFPLALFFAILWIAIFAIAGLYKVQRSRGAIDEFARIFLACSASISIVMASMFFTRYLFDSRFIILASWLLSIIFISAERMIIRNFQKMLYRYGIGIHRVILVGDGERAHALKNFFLKNPRLGYVIVGEFDEYTDSVRESVAELSEKNVFDELIQVDVRMPREKMLELAGLVQERHKDFKYIADLLGAKASNFEIFTFGDIPIIESKRTPLDGWGKIMKRMFDAIFSIFFILLFSPLMILCAAAIKIDSRGPIFFRYKRVGEEGREITFIKFRTMVKDAHLLRFDKNFLAVNKNLREGSPLLKIQNDPRVTRAGRFLRRWSIDELPQFFLVLFGKMSLVGPRPHEIEEVGQYNKIQRRLLAIKPGITGLSQVAGRSDLDFNEEVKLDTYYIEHWSLGLDIKIILKTPAAIFKRRKAV